MNETDISMSAQEKARRIAKRARLFELHKQKLDLATEDALGATDLSRSAHTAGQRAPNDGAAADFLNAALSSFGGRPLRD